MANGFYTARVSRIIEETSDVKRYFIDIEGINSYDFLPGQFVMLDLPIEHEFTTRSYSIASAPNGTNQIELCIVLKEDGAGTPFLFKDIMVGSTVKVSAPQGRFVLNENIETDVCFICTGTGIAPFRSMLQHILTKNIPHQNLHLVFGNRFEADILYRKEFEEMAAQYPQFHFHPVLSRENANWQGATGYVHPIYETLFADKRPAVFYICGWSDMVREAKNRLKAMDYTRRQINFELYD
jgi:ferredoxin-NADP reductase